MNTEEIVLGGGCFWCTEAVFQQVKGVESVESGYAGGHAPNPRYEDICTGATGHAEVVRLRFDPAVINLRQILEIFFTTHDPTTLNRQGNDVGTQYRSVIFTANETQEHIARQVMGEMANVWDAPIVTQIQPLPTFYKAEDYHQDYFNQHPFQGYCAFVVAPKVAKLREMHADKVRPTA